MNAQETYFIMGMQQVAIRLESSVVIKPASISIRPWADQDLPLLERLMGDPEIMAHLGGPETPENIRERHQRYCRGIAPGTGCMFAIVLQPEGIAVGSVGYWETEWQEEPAWETGWMVLPEYQGRGIASRATAAAIARARSEMKHRYVYAFPSIDNFASNAICRKLGFENLGEVAVDYPPGNFMRCCNWRLDLFPDRPTQPSP